jgi:sialidase-1
MVATHYRFSLALQEEHNPMKLCISTAMMLALLGELSAVAKAAPFEETLAVRVPMGKYGPRGMMGDFIVLKDGTILMSFTLSPTGHGYGGIGAVKSTDQGKTWSAPLTLVATPQPPALGAYCLPSFLRLASGNIMLSYIYVTDAVPDYGHNYFRLSADEGKTWTDQFAMMPHPGYVLAHNDRLMTLSTGRILSIAEYRAYNPPDDHAGYVGITFLSDDQGKSWRASKNTVDMQPIEVQEADAVELKDGRIMMFARTYSGHPVRAYSGDGGETWSKGEVIKELVQPYAGFPTVRRIPATGDLLFIFCGERSTPPDGGSPLRSGLTCAVSQDEGRTFIHQRNIAHDPKDDFGYQCVEFIGKDLALVGYHAREGLRVARIGIDWFYEK